MTFRTTTVIYIYVEERHNDVMIYDGRGRRSRGYVKKRETSNVSVQPVGWCYLPPAPSQPCRSAVGLGSRVVHCCACCRGKREGGSACACRTGSGDSLASTCVSLYYVTPIHSYDQPPNHNSICPQSCQRFPTWNNTRRRKRKQIAEAYSARQVLPLVVACGSSCFCLLVPTNTNLGASVEFALKEPRKHSPALATPSLPHRLQLQKHPDQLRRPHHKVHATKTQNI